MVYWVEQHLSVGLAKRLMEARKGGQNG
jgi:hypothetical protein